MSWNKEEGAKVKWPRGMSPREHKLFARIRALEKALDIVLKDAPTEETLDAIDDDGLTGNRPVGLYALKIKDLREIWRLRKGTK